MNGLALLAGGAAVLLLSSKKSGGKRAPSSSKGENLDNEEEEVFETADPESNEIVDEGPKGVAEIPAISKYIPTDGRPRLGSFYQVKELDTPQSVAKEALFGSADIDDSPEVNQAVHDLIIRMNCSYWNQSAYAVDAGSGYGEIVFDRIYQNNLKRMLSGGRPTAESGSSYPGVWIPMINIEILEEHGVVTCEGVYHNDGTSMIEPPKEITEIPFDLISQNVEPCNLPEFG